jgi:parallel beta-helix repeat protein
MGKRGTGRAMERRRMLTAGVSVTGRVKRRARTWAIVLVGLLVGLGLGAPYSPTTVAAATTYYVGNTIGGTVTTTGCTSNTNNTCTLNGALSLATSGNDIIQFSTQFPQGGTITLTDNGGNSIVLDTSVTIDGGTKAPVLSGGCPDCGVGGSQSPTTGYRVFVVHSTATAVNLVGLTITKGNSHGGAHGGILNQGTLTLTNCTVTGNTATGYGGGIGNDGGALTLVNSIVSSNLATYPSGGGIYNTNNGTVTLQNSTVSGNAAQGGGGGIFNQFGRMMLTNSTVSGNTTQEGGGIANGGTLVLANSTVSGNTATNGRGGGIVNESSGTFALANSTVSGNTSSAEGGGIADNSGSLTLTNVTVSNNTAGTQGGGVYIEGVPVAEDNSIVAGNHGGSDQVANGGSFTGSNDITSGDPKLNPLGNNGGATQTMLPRLDSPAVDAYAPTGGNCGSYIDPITMATVNITTDQRGLTRPQGTKCDIGAVDIVGPSIYYVGSTYGGPVAAPNIQDCADPANATCTLRGALSLVAAGDSVRFSSAFPQGGTIKATDGGGNTFTVNTSVTIDGGTKAPVLSGGCTGCGVAGGINYSGGVIVLTVHSGVTASLTALTITAGNSGINHDSGAGIGNSGTLTLTNVTVRDNTLKSGSGGGGIYNNGTLTLTNSTVSGNYVESASGGGIYSTGATATVTLVNSTVRGNFAASFGGGIETFQGTLTLTNSTVNGNSSNEGGGIYNTGTTTVTNSTVSDNSASHDGGGVNQSGGQTTLTNSTVSGNQAGTTAGGIFLANGSTVTRNNTIVAGNRQGSGGDETILFNNGTLAGNGNLISTAASPVNPLLTPLGDYGGPTQTMVPLPGSPAIDPAAPAACTGLTALDQRGKPRVGRCDIGAVESQGFVFTAVSGSGQSAQPGNAFGRPLVVRLLEAGGSASLPGAVVTVMGQASGAGIAPASPATTDATGQASIAVTANAVVGGPYTVTATAGGTTSATFTLTNGQPAPLPGGRSGGPAAPGSPGPAPAPRTTNGSSPGTGNPAPQPPPRSG